MRSWKIGTIIAVVAGLAALLVGAFGLGMAVGTGGTGAAAPAEPDPTRYWFLAIPALAVVGGSMASWNPEIGAVLLVLAAGAVLALFGLGIIPLILAAALAIAAFLVWMET